MESLTLEQAYYIGELIASIAVITSLIYLALQVRAGNQMAKMTALDSFSPRYEQAMASLTTPDNASLFLQASQNYETMNEDQKLMFQGLLFVCFSVLEDFYLISKSGVYTIDPGARKSIVHRFLVTTGGRAAWRDIRDMFEGEYRDDIDTIADSNGVNMFSW